jgi:hypothetical protein
LGGAVLEDAGGVVVGSDVADFTSFCKSTFGGEVFTVTSGAAVLTTVSFTLLSIFKLDAAALRGFNLYAGTKVDLSFEVELPLLGACLEAAAKEDVFLGADDADVFDDDGALPLLA